MPQRTNTLPLLALLAALLLVVGLVYGPRLLNAPRLNNPEAVERVPEPRTGSDPEEDEAVRVFKQTRDSVVNVDTVVRVRQLDMRVAEQQTGTGSGFLWDDEGRVVTNFHVVREAATSRGTLRVVLADRSAYDATLVGAAPEFDLAVLQIAAPKEKLKKIRVGRSGDLEVGHKVYAIGNPFGLSLSMTKGIVSALDREIDSQTDRTITGVIQTDAPINPGNSGGPLLDRDGRLVGVNTAIKSPSGGNVGIGFAIPVDTVNPVVTELIQRGRTLQPDVGLKLVDQRRVRRAGFATGVMVQSVEPLGPAEKAGLRGVVADRQTGDVSPGDVIVKVNGVAVAGNAEFTKTLSNAKPGDVWKLSVERDGEARGVEVTVRGV